MRQSMEMWMAFWLAVALLLLVGMVHRKARLERELRQLQMEVKALRQHNLTLANRQRRRALEQQVRTRIPGAGEMHSRKTSGTTRH